MKYMLEKIPFLHHFYKFNKKWLIIGTLIILILLSASYGTFRFWTNRNQESPEILASKAANKDAKQLVDEVGKLMVLPSDKLPTIATVTDLEKLKDQPFFEKAQNGNKVLVFEDAKIAILYDPKIKKLVNLGPLVTNDAPTQSQPQQAKIILRNGTNVSGLTIKAETDLQKNFPGLDIQGKEQAASSDYDKTVIVALKPEAQAPATLLAKFLNGTVSELPKEETLPEGMDILVILGNDYADLIEPTATQ